MSYPSTIVRDVDQPPGGWRYTVEQTGVEIKAASARTLRTRIKQHLKANSLPVPEDFEAWANDAICQQSGLGSPFCGGVVAKPDGKMPHLSLAMASRFIRTVIGVIISRKLVSREEAERRVAICNACPLASSIGGCRSCVSAFRQIERALAKCPITTSPEKEFCGSCGCLTRLHVLVPNSTLDRAMGEKRPPYHADCWRLEANAPSDTPEEGIATPQT